MHPRFTNRYTITAARFYGGSYQSPSTPKKKLPTWRGTPPTPTKLVQRPPTPSKFSVTIRDDSPDSSPPLQLQHGHSQWYDHSIGLDWRLTRRLQSEKVHHYHKKRRGGDILQKYTTPMRRSNEAHRVRSERPSEAKCAERFGNFDSPTSVHETCQV